jgi:hypothetical protein
MIKGIRMPVLEKNLKNSISEYLKKPEFNNSDKRWYITYVDLNTGSSYNIRFFSEDEATKYYFERYRYLQKFILNILSKCNIKGK